ESPALAAARALRAGGFPPPGCDRGVDRPRRAARSLCAGIAEILLEAQQPRGGLLGVDLVLACLDRLLQATHTRRIDLGGVLNRLRETRQQTRMGGDLNAVGVAERRV